MKNYLSKVDDNKAIKILTRTRVAVPINKPITRKIFKLIQFWGLVLKKIS